MTEQERTWDRMSPEAKNMILNIDPNFTPDKLPTPVKNDSDVYFERVRGSNADYIYRSVWRNGMMVIKHISECLPHDGINLYKVDGFYLGLKTQPFRRKYILAKNTKEAKLQYKHLFGWDAVHCYKITNPEEKKEVLCDYKKMPLF